MAIIGGAIITATAFTAGQAIYDQFRSADSQKRQEAIDKLNQENIKWNKRRAITLDYLNNQLKLKEDGISSFNDIDIALAKYNELYPESNMIIPQKPKLSDYYQPSQEKINYDYSILIIGGIFAGFVIYRYL